MLELRLQTGPVVAFDGRIVEIFSDGDPSLRFHVAQLGAPELRAADDGRALVLAHGTVVLPIADEDAPACRRLIAAIEDSGELNR